MRHIILIVLGSIVLGNGCQSKHKENIEIKSKSKEEKMTSYELGKSIFNGKGKCYTCHKMDKKFIGPGISEIVKIYKEKKGDLISFLKQRSEPIVDPQTYTVMKTNFVIIETFTEKELKALEMYMLEGIK